MTAQKSNRNNQAEAPLNIFPPMWLVQGVLSQQIAVVRMNLSADVTVKSQMIALKNKSEMLL